MLFSMPFAPSRTWLPLLALSVGPAAHGFAQEAPPEPPNVVEPLDLSPPPVGYRSSDSLGAGLLELQKASKKMELRRLWVSPEDHPMWLASFGASKIDSNRPEALILANLEGDRLVATEMAMALIQHLSTDDSPWDQAGIVHILPVANPDAYARALAGMEPWRGATVDEDRDGRLDEDGPTDLDGDGHALWMRIPSKAGKWHANSSDSRVLEAVESAKEQGGSFVLHREALDADGDRHFGEDPLGGIRVDANFPHRWPQYTAEGGAYPMSEPEASAIAQFVLSRKRLAWVLVLDDEDNLASPPKGVEKFDIQATDPLSADAAFLKAWGERLYPKDEAKRGSNEDSKGEPKAEAPLETKEEAKVESAPESHWTPPVSADQGKGNFADWAYYQRGLFALESAVWTLPTKGGEAGASDELKRLQWAQRHYTQGAFADWRPYQHPNLGNVEIGGWFPLVQTNPPAEWLPEFGGHYVAFVDRLAMDFAQLEWVDVTKVPLDSEGVVEISATLANVGFLPTSTAMGLKNRSRLPILVELRLPEGARVLVGQPKHDIANLPGGGGSEELSWIVQLPRGSAAPVLIATCDTAGQASYNLE